MVKIKIEKNDCHYTLKKGRDIIAEGVEFNSDENDPLKFRELLKWSFEALQEE